LISQSLEVGLIPFLLGLLDSRLEFVDNASAVKAQIVAALKGMTHNLNYGDRVTQILLKHPVWAEFKDQRHDLFITDTNIRGYLTGKLTIVNNMFIILLTVINQSFRHQPDGGLPHRRTSAKR